MSIILWIATIELLGLLAFPIAFLLFHRLGDRGYGLAKPLGLLLLAYPVWLVGSLGVAPVTRWTIVVALLLLAGLVVALAQRHWREMADFLRRRWPLLLAIEGVFLILFLGWVVFRAYDPMINHTEQLMDFAFLNASVHATSYPPTDPWLQGHGISYYYFGHLMMGLLTKLTGISSEVSYNLSLALVPAMAGAGLLSLVVALVAGAGASLRRAFVFGLVGVLLLGLVGNGEGVLEFANARAVGSAGFWEGVGIKDLQTPVGEASWIPDQTWWWFRATRVIDTLAAGQSLDYTIQEFPLFSFFLGDLHAHVMSLPFLMLALGFGLNLLSSQEPLGLSWLKRRWSFVLLMGLALGALGVVNAWDLPTFLGLVLGLLTLHVYRSLFGGGWRDALGSLALTFLGLTALAVLLYLPFYWDLATQVTRVRLVEEPVTRPLHFIIVWGGFLALLAPFLVLQVVRAARERFSRGLGGAALAVALAAFFIWGVAAVTSGLAGEVIPRFLHLALGMALLALLFYRTLRVAEEGSDPSLLGALALVGYGFLLLLGPELFYVVDVFNSRINTVFKLYYQAWAILAVVSPVCLYYGARTLARAGRGSSSLGRRAAAVGWAALVALPLLGGGYYAVGALADKADGFRGDPTLDGLAYLKDGQAGEYAAIQWLRENAGVGDAILEAVGGDYSAFGRVAASTGLPTVLSWPGHELQWRGSLEPQAGRAEDVAAIYQGGDAGQVGRLLRRYDIRYVLVGPRERQAYGQDGLEALDRVLDRVFSHEGVTIYRVRTGET